MKILVSKAPASLAEYWDHPAFGVLTVPTQWHRMDSYAPRFWAMDNGAFSGFDEPAFVKMLDTHEGVEGCRWVACPDVVGDADATLDKFEDYWKLIDGYGFPIALVGQDGLLPADVPWKLIDCLFIGGSTHWKMGEAARLLIDHALIRGKLVHMGRVNGRRRLRYAKAVGCHSVDGTKYARWTRLSLPGDLEFALNDSQGIMEAT